MIPSKIEQKDERSDVLHLITLWINLLVLGSDTNGSCPGSVYIILWVKLHLNTSWNFLIRAHPQQIT